MTLTKSPLLTASVIATAAAAGWWVRQQYLKTHPQPKTLLKNIRAQFSHDAPIRDAWISKHKQAYEHFGANQTVFRGGFTRIEGNALIPYEFAVDSTDGTIVDLKKITFN